MGYNWVSNNYNRLENASQGSYCIVQSMISYLRKVWPTASNQQNCILKLRMASVIAQVIIGSFSQSIISSEVKFQDAFGALRKSYP